MEARELGGARLGDGDVVEWLAVIHAYRATLWLPPGWRGAVVGSGAVAVAAI